MKWWNILRRALPTIGLVLVFVLSSVPILDAPAFADKAEDICAKDPVYGGTGAAFKAEWLEYCKKGYDGYSKSKDAKWCDSLDYGVDLIGNKRNACNHGAALAGNASNGPNGKPRLNENSIYEGENGEKCTQTGSAANVGLSNPDYTYSTYSYDCGDNVDQSVRYCFTAFQKPSNANPVLARNGCSDTPYDAQGELNKDLAAEDSAGGGGSGGDTCGDGEPLGWIFCPIARAVTGLVDTLINQLLLPMLQWRIIV